MENYILFTCPDCGDYSCIEGCGEGALASFYSNIMADTQKCAPCKVFKKKGLKEGLPYCIVKCGKKCTKTLISVPDMCEKRTFSVEGLGIIENYKK